MIDDPTMGFSNDYVISMKVQTEHMTMLRHILAEYSKKSLLLKSTSMLIVSALLISAAEADVEFYYYLVALIPISFFWILDGYYRKEELLYINEIRKRQIEDRCGYGPKLEIHTRLLTELIIEDNPSKFHYCLKKLNTFPAWLAPSLLFFYPTLILLIAGIGFVACL